MIICDWTSCDFNPGQPITVLREALTTWSGGTKLKNPPYLLKGGFEKFLLAYPLQVTNPRARAPNQNQKLHSEGQEALNISYPDLDAAFMTTPSPGGKNASQPGPVANSRDSTPVESVQRPSYLAFLALFL